MSDKTELGKRMKDSYESRVRYYLPRRTYTVIRLDGKAFHTYTRGLQKPFDKDLIEDFDDAVIHILPQIQGAQFAYVQSDEASILLTDFNSPQTDAWFDGNIQKIASVSASLMTAEFNKLRFQRAFCEVLDKANFVNQGFIKSAIQNPKFSLASFDSRVFTIPDPTEVYNYFVWRNQDAARNSISMVAQSLFSHKELYGKNGNEMQEMIFEKGINWANYDEKLKNGRLIIKEIYQAEVFVRQFGKPFELNDIPIRRTRWISKPAPVFTRYPETIKSLIPVYK